MKIQAPGTPWRRDATCRDAAYEPTPVKPTTLSHLTGTRPPKLTR